MTASMISEQALDWTKRRRKTVNDPNQPSYDQGGDWGGNTNAPQGGVGPAPDTRPPGERGHGIGDGIGGPDDSTPLFPDVQINTKVFFSRIKGPILKAFLAITVLTVLVAVLKLMVNVVLGFVGVGPMVIQISSGLFQFMLALVGLVVGVLQVALAGLERRVELCDPFGDLVGTGARRRRVRPGPAAGLAAPPQQPAAHAAQGQTQGDSHEHRDGVQSCPRPLACLAAPLRGGICRPLRRVTQCTRSSRRSFRPPRGPWLERGQRTE